MGGGAGGAAAVLVVIIIFYFYRRYTLKVGAGRAPPAAGPRGLGLTRHRCCAAWPQTLEQKDDEEDKAAAVAPAPADADSTSGPIVKQ